jgi:four helix bundle protein
MATIKRFEDLDIWQLARELNIKITPLLDKLNESRNYDLKSQLDRSAGSVMDNIAEGFERDGNREFIQFLAISKGSLGEVRSQLYRALDRNFLEEDFHLSLQEYCLALAGKIANFIKYLNNTEHRGNKFKKETQN